MKIINDISLNLPHHATKIFEKRDLNKIDTIIIHQTDSDDLGDYSPYDIARYHVQNNGWAGIGYHYYIIDSGKIFQTQPLYNISYHTSGYNSNSVGVVISGKHRYDSDKSNAEIIGKKKYKALIYALAKLQNQLPTSTEIISHGSVSTHKTDPNLNMDELRVDVKKKRTILFIQKVFIGILLIGLLIYAGKKWMS